MKLPALLLRPLRRVITLREPDFVVGGLDRPYMLRWWAIPRNRFLNVYIHRFRRSDDDRALHDHPWCSMSILLQGSYLEHTPSGVVCRNEGAVAARCARARHRVELLPDGRGGEHEVLTLFLTGPKTREWGFWCRQGWVHWRQFVSPSDSGAVGRGCGEP